MYLICSFHCAVMAIARGDIPVEGLDDAMFIISLTAEQLNRFHSKPEEYPGAAGSEVMLARIPLLVEAVAKAIKEGRAIIKPSSQHIVNFTVVNLLLTHNGYPAMQGEDPEGRATYSPARVAAQLQGVAGLEVLTAI